MIWISGAVFINIQNESDTTKIRFEKLFVPTFSLLSDISMRAETSFRRRLGSELKISG
jgi:hypothetical protein